MNKKKREDVRLVSAIILSFPRRSNFAQMIVFAEGKRSSCLGKGYEAIYCTWQKLQTVHKTARSERDRLEFN